MRHLAFLRRSIAGLPALLVLLATIAIPAQAFAATDPFQSTCAVSGAAASTLCTSKSGTQDPLTGPTGIITKVTIILATVAGIISVIFIIVGGIKYITANGDSSSIASAKSTIIYALIGLLVAVLARPMINFVIGLAT
jgi:hypothetical protein